MTSDARCTRRGTDFDVDAVGELCATRFHLDHHRFEHRPGLPSLSQAPDESSVGTHDILSYLSPDDQPLRNCSLVAKAWIDPGRSRLFDSSKR